MMKLAQLMSNSLNILFQLAIMNNLRKGEGLPQACPMPEPLAIRDNQWIMKSVLLKKSDCNKNLFKSRWIKMCSYGPIHKIPYLALKGLTSHPQSPHGMQ
jgi:hypothetical protein